MSARDTAIPSEKLNSLAQPEGATNGHTDSSFAHVGDNSPNVAWSKMQSSAPPAVSQGESGGWVSDDGSINFSQAPELYANSNPSWANLVAPAPEGYVGVAGGTPPAPEDLVGVAAAAPAAHLGFSAEAVSAPEAHVASSAASPLESASVQPFPDAVHTSDAPPLALETLSSTESFDQQWEAKKDSLSMNIADRINSRQVSEPEFWQAAQFVPENDKLLAHKVLENSAANVTDRGVLKTAKSIAMQLSDVLHADQFKNIDFYSASPASSGTFFSYLTRKSTNGDQHTRFLIDGIKKGNDPVVVFENPLNLSPNLQEQLLNARRDVIFVDTSNFDKSPNFIDFANGASAVSEKLNKLVTGIKSATNGDRGLSEDDAIKGTMHSWFDESVEVFGAQLDRRFAVHGIKPDEVTSEDSFKKMVSTEDVHSFIEARPMAPKGAAVDNENIPPALTKLAIADALQNAVQFDSFGSIVNDLRKLHDTREESAQREGGTTRNDVYVVGNEQGKSSSEGLMTFLYAQANGIPEDQLLTFKQLEELRTGGKSTADAARTRSWFKNTSGESAEDDAQNLPDRKVVSIDDTIYSGTQAWEKSDDTLKQYSNVTIAALGAYNVFAKQFDQKQDPSRELVALTTHLSNKDNPLDSGRSEVRRKMDVVVRDGRGWSNLATLKLMPYMASDTSPDWLRQFANEYIINPTHQP